VHRLHLRQAAEADAEAIRSARLREKAEAKAAAEATARFDAERSNEALSQERAEAELRATSTVQARIAAEEGLTRKTLEAQDAASHSAEVRDLRMEYERKLAALRRPARRRLAIAIAVAGLLAIGAWLAPRFQQPSSGPQVAQQISGGPLRLKLEYRLSK